jgi:hypothetical protein
MYVAPRFQEQKMSNPAVFPDLAIIFPRALLDVVSIAILLFLFYRNHRRSDLVAVYLACNVGLFSVLTVLSFSPLSSSIGFALFGVLSIIRLRSVQFETIEIAYFFISLALALTSAIDLTSTALPTLLNVLMLVAMLLVDLQKFRNGSFHTELIVDQVITDVKSLAIYLEQTRQLDVVKCEIRSINYLQETTLASVVLRTKGFQ